jgi:hypothetical protein
VKISSPLFTHLSGPDVVLLLHALLLDRLALELTDNWSAYSSISTPRVEDLPEPAQLLLQLANALLPTREPV